MLASTATQKGDLSALASSTATLWQSYDCTGLSDKQPVLVQHAEQGAKASTGNIFPLHGLLAGNPPNIPLERNPVGEPSLPGEPGCLSLHVKCSTNVQERQEKACDARGNASLCLKAGDSLPLSVESSPYLDLIHRRKVGTL